MQRLLSVLVLGGGLAFLAGEYAPSPSDREEQIAAMTRIVARATILEPETVPAEQPGLRRPIASPAAVTTTPVPSTTAPLTTAAITPVTVATPATLPVAKSEQGAEIQRRLAREIQAELKRVGCYTGRLDGSWGDRSRSAMLTFMDRVNAQLPTMEPDVFLLSLIKGQTDTVCGPECGRNEVVRNNRCVARTVVADARQPQPFEASDTRGEAPRATQPAAVAAVRGDPLPGRMSIGGPVEQAVPAPQPVTAAPAQETLPWQKPAATPPPPERELAALEPQDAAGAAYRAPPAPRRVTKVKRSWVAPRPKPVKRRYSSQRSVQMLFMHPLGRM